MRKCQVASSRTWSFALLHVARRAFHAQRDTPILPQARVRDPPPESAPSSAISVGYLLTRQPVVKPTPHPLEHEWSFLLEREHNRYARHSEENTTVFFGNRGMSIDSWGRQDPKQVQGNFFNMELYQDAVGAVTKRYSPASRLQRADFEDPFDPAVTDISGPPTRHTLNRRLCDYLFLIVKFAPSGLWGVPYGPRKTGESLRLTLDRVVLTQHGDNFDTYCASNAPQGVISLPPGVATEEGTSPAAGNSDTAATSGDRKLFVFTTSYLSGRPRFDGFSDHAWVTRSELNQYEFERGTEMRTLLRDIAPDAYYEQP